MGDKIKKIIRGIIVVFIIIIIAGIFFGDDEENIVDKGENKVSEDIQKNNVIVEKKADVIPFTGKVSCTDPNAMKLLKFKEIYDVTESDITVSTYAANIEGELSNKPNIVETWKVQKNDGVQIEWNSVSKKGQTYKNVIDTDYGTIFTDLVLFRPNERKFEIRLGVKCSVIK